MQRKEKPWWKKVQPKDVEDVEKRKVKCHDMRGDRVMKRHVTYGGIKYVQIRRSNTFNTWGRR